MQLILGKPATTALLAALLFAIAPVPAFALDPDVEAVTRIVEAAHGKVEKTEDGQSLRLVDLAVPGAGPHAHRKDDPYDAAFFEQLGRITALESLNVISTKANDEWIQPLGKLTNLKTLRFTNNGKLTDAGMETFAGLTQLETFSFVGTHITGRAYAKCADWSKVTRVSHRGSRIDDEGLKELCEHLPNVESISLAHAHFTDAGAPHLAKLTKLKGLEIGASEATSQSLAHIARLPLEYLQLGEGFYSPESIPFIKDLGSLRRLTITNVQKFTDSDLQAIADMKQLEQLELGRIELSEARLAIFQNFTHLKSLRLIPVKVPFTAETQAQVKALLPQVEITFQ
ncbi:leucine-rich repeat domain-containing protein [Lignipirellula cremea]|nr:hypothetical protein [Lignipirellula cremea]